MPEPRYIGCRGVLRAPAVRAKKGKRQSVYMPVIQPRPMTHETPQISNVVVASLIESTSSLAAPAITQAAASFSGQTVDQITSTSARISWSVSPNSTGQIEYGTTTAYGSTSALEAGLLSAHIQTINGLNPGTTYHYRLLATNGSGAAADIDRTFATTGAVGSSTYYGSAHAMDSKNNHQVRSGANLYVAARFTAPSTTTVTSVIMPIRGNGNDPTPDYSNGDGGTLRFGIQACDGTNFPTGAYLGSTVDYSPGNPSGHWEIHPEHTFVSKPAITSAGLYAAVVENVHASPNSNWSSINTSYVFGTPTSPRQYSWPDDDLATLLHTGGAWSLSGGNTPACSIKLTDGNYAGQAYFAVLNDKWAYVSGVNQVRQRFTKSGGTILVDRIGVRLGRESGTGDLTVGLYTQAGVFQDGGTITGTTFQLVSPPASAGTGVDCGSWGWFDLSPSVTLTNGVAYELRLSAPSGLLLWTMPIRHANDPQGPAFGAWPPYGSLAFTDGINVQKSPNSGSTWSDFYGFAPNHLQFALRVA